MSSTRDDDLGELLSLLDLRPRRAQRRAGARSPSLSREQIIRAAIDLADSEGPEAISMRRIAGRLGVGAMTLYGYVADRDTLIARMINEVAAEMNVPDRPSGNWRHDLENVARSLKDICQRHSWLPAELGTVPFLIAPRLLAPAELVLAALQPLGADLQTSGAILRLLNNYVIGTTLREAAGPPGTSADGEADYQSAMAAYLQQHAMTGRYPLMTQLGRTVLDGTVLPPDQSFELGLQCLLDGIEVLLASKSRPDGLTGLGLAAAAAGPMSDWAGCPGPGPDRSRSLAVRRAGPPVRLAPGQPAAVAHDELGPGVLAQPEGLGQPSHRLRVRPPDAPALQAADRADAEPGPSASSC
jgi:AcrR family transcriptional regulator